MYNILFIPTTKYNKREQKAIMYKYINGTKWMPWLIHPMKDAQDCDKPGEVVTKRYNPGFPNGGTLSAKADNPIWMDTCRIEIS